MKKAANLEDPGSSGDAAVAAIEPQYRKQETTFGSWFEHHAARIFICPPSF